MDCADINFFDEETLRIRFLNAAAGSNSFIIPRYKFDNELVKLAVETGAYFVKAKVTGLIGDGNRVAGVKSEADGSKFELLSNVVIGADGSNSRIARLLNPAQNKNSVRAVAYRAYIDNFQVEDHCLEAFFDRGFFPAYYWIFPVSDTKVNIGLGCKLGDKRLTGKNLKQEFLKFLRSPEIKRRIGINSEITEMQCNTLNLGYDRNYKRVFDGALLVGDAANLVNPLTGGGICNAIISAKLAAETIIEAVGRNDFSETSLYGYNEKLTSAIERDMKIAGYLYNFYSSAPKTARFIIRNFLTSGPLPFFLRRMYPDVQFEKSGGKIKL